MMAVSAFAQMPAHLRTALNRFVTDVPPGWAYTLTTTRNGQEMVERFDPSRPPAEQWRLITLFGREPTADEREKYLLSRPTSTGGGSHANFQRADIDPASLKLVSEDETIAVYEGEFREQATAGDKMLSHLILRLSVDKAAAYILRYTLQLKEPYWPVLGVKMNQLSVVAEFSPPHAETPSLPSAHASEFSGRMLLMRHEEKLTLKFEEFRRVR